MRVVVVTGASRGIGRAIALRLGVPGQLVVCLYKERHHLAQETVQAIEDQGGTAVALQTDVGDPRAVAGAFDTIRTRWGGVDTLINNAGIDYYGLLQNMSYEDWRDLFRVNVDGVFLCTRQVLPDMLARQQGVIINMSSVWGSHSAAMECAYAASKGAVEAFTRSLAVEVASCGIRVNAVAPGVVDTEMLQCLSEADRVEVCASIPIGRFARADEIAAFVAFLCSEEAVYMTGQILKPDGGFLI